MRMRLRFGQGEDRPGGSRVTCIVLMGRNRKRGLG